MRNARIRVALMVLCASSARAQTPASPTTLQQRVEAIAAAHHGSVALFAANIATHDTVALRPDEPVQTASTIKLAILYEAMEQVRDGKSHWDDKITLAKTDQVPGSGELLFFDTPLTLTFKDVLTLMTQISDNTAANLAMDHVGIDNVNKRLAALGLKDTYLYKKVFQPAPTGVTMPADQKKFGLGKTTAREMATLMTKIVTCDLGGPARPTDPARPASTASPARPTDPDICATAQHMLHVQFYRSAADRYLDAMPGATGDSIANKTGSLNAVRNDVAAVATKNGLVVISCFTFENKDQSWGAEQEGELTIAKIAREIVSTWSPSGLTAWPAPAASADAVPKK